MNKSRVLLLSFPTPFAITYLFANALEQTEKMGLLPC